VLTYSSYLAEPHKYQLRAYIYQARDLLASDADGFSGYNTQIKIRKIHLTVCVMTRLGWYTRLNWIEHYSLF